MVGDTDLVRTDHIVHRSSGRVVIDATVSLLTEHHIVDELVHILQEFSEFSGRHNDLIIVDVVLHGLTILEDPAGALDRTLISPVLGTVSMQETVLRRTTGTAHMVFRDILCFRMILSPGLLVAGIGLFRILLMTTGERSQAEHHPDPILTFQANCIQALPGILIRQPINPSVPDIGLLLVRVIPGQAAVVVGCALLEGIFDVVTLVILLENDNGVNHRATKHILLVLKVLLDEFNNVHSLCVCFLLQR
jgi:hypothetical protein